MGVKRFSDNHPVGPSLGEGCLGLPLIPYFPSLGRMLDRLRTYPFFRLTFGPRMADPESTNSCRVVRFSIP
jgi:hypothetical protein